MIGDVGLVTMVVREKEKIKTVLKVMRDMMGRLLDCFYIDGGDVLLYA